MGRAPRPTDEGLVYHATNRGNNRARVFADEDDHRAFLHSLTQTQLRYPFRLYGYCLMSNHFHLLLKPEAGVAVSRILQSLTVAHTWRYEAQVDPIRRSLRDGLPFGSPAWLETMAEKLGRPLERRGEGDPGRWKNETAPVFSCFFRRFFLFDTGFSVAASDNKAYILNVP